MIQFVLSVILSSATFADASVWDQESGAVFEAKVQDVKLEGYQVTYEKDNLVQTTELCTTDEAVNKKSTESERALAIGLRVQKLLSAKKNNQTIKLGFRGPWNPCVFPVSI